ncbi:MAG: hypothetical protein AB1721_02670 [Patescibacteria group bacterium]
MFKKQLFAICHLPFAKRGQTIIEMLVILAIATMFTSMLITFNRTANNQNQLLQFADKFILDIRRVQDLAYLSQEYNGPNPDYQGQVPCGYGIGFNQETGDKYFIFAVFNSDCSRVSSGDYSLIELEQIALPSLIRISETSSNPVIFIPPYPRSIFFPAAESMIIKLVLRGSEETAFKNIIINRAGQISQIN